MEIPEILARYDVLLANRKNVEFTWNRIDKYIMPLRLGDFFLTPQLETSIHWERDEIYDSTAIVAAEDFASNVHGALTPATMRWYTAKWKDPRLNEDQESVEWMETSLDILWDNLYESNFDSELTSALLDWSGPGTCDLFLEPENEVAPANKHEWGGFNFSTKALRELFFEQDHRGRAGVIYIRLQWTPRQARSKFPHLSIEQLPKSLQTMIKDPGALDQRIEIVYCIFPRESKRENLGKMDLAEDQRPFGSKYIIKASAEEIDTERGLYELPGSVARYGKTSGSMWGYGIGTLMAPTAEYINNWMMYEDEEVRLQLQGNYLVNERGLMSNLDRRPGGMTLVRDVKTSVAPMPASGNVILSMKKLEELRAQINAAFKKDAFQLPTQGPQMSAAEAQIRYYLIMRILGPPAARLQQELLVPTLDRGLKLLYRNHQLPPIPAMVKKLGAAWKFEFWGPLMRALQQDEAAVIERLIGSLGGASKVEGFQDMTKVVDPIRAGQAMAKRLGVPRSILRSDVEIKQAQEAEQAQKQQMQQAQIAEQTGKGMKAVAEGAQAHQQAGQPPPGAQQ